MTAREIATIVLASAGLIFMLVSLTGMIRFPDFFTRLHAQGIGDTLGAMLIIAAMMVAVGAHLMTIKLFIIFAAILATNPMGTNLMMIAAIHRKDYQDYLRKVPDVRRNEDPAADDSAHADDSAAADAD